MRFFRDPKAKVCAQLPSAWMAASVPAGHAVRLGSAKLGTRYASGSDRGGVRKGFPCSPAACGVCQRLSGRRRVPPHQAAGKALGAGRSGWDAMSAPGLSRQQRVGRRVSLGEPLLLGEGAAQRLYSPPRQQPPLAQPGGPGPSGDPCNRLPAELGEHPVLPPWPWAPGGTCARSSSRRCSPPRLSPRRT